MSERDGDIWDGFARRLGEFDDQLPDPPGRSWPTTRPTAPTRPSGAQRSMSVAGLLGIAIVVALGALLAIGRPSTPDPRVAAPVTESPSAPVVSITTTPRPLTTAEATAHPPDSTASPLPAHRTADPACPSASGSSTMFGPITFQGGTLEGRGDMSLVRDCHGTSGEVVFDSVRVPAATGGARAVCVIRGLRYLFDQELEGDVTIGRVDCPEGAREPAFPERVRVTLTTYFSLGDDREAFYLDTLFSGLLVEAASPTPVGNSSDDQYATVFLTAEPGRLPPWASRMPAASPIPIVEVDDARQAIIWRLQEATGHRSCASSWSGTIPLPSDAEFAAIDAQAAESTDGFWHDPVRYGGTMWVGEREGAPAAFGATFAARGEKGFLWLQVGSGATLQGIGLLRIETPAGNAIWVNHAGERAIPCSGIGPTAVAPSTAPPSPPVSPDKLLTYPPLPTPLSSGNLA